MTMKVYYAGNEVDKAELRNAPEERYSWLASVRSTRVPLFSYLPVGVDLVTWRYEDQYGNYLVWLRFKNAVTPRTVYMQLKSLGMTFCSVVGSTARSVLDAWVENGDNFALESN